VLDALGKVAVGWVADVPALAGVGLQAVAGGLQQLQRIPLGHPLLHAAGQDLGGVFAAVGLVGGQQDDAYALEFVFDLGAEVGDAGHSVDGLAGDGVEGAVRAGGFGEQLADTAVAAHGDVEQFVGAAEAALVEFGAAGLDVVEAAGDGRAGRQVALDAVEWRGMERVGSCCSTVEVRPRNATRIGIVPWWLTAVWVGSYGAEAAWWVASAGRRLGWAASGSGRGGRGAIGVPRGWRALARLGVWHLRRH
jgi:hypothetical protein